MSPRAIAADRAMDLERIEAIVRLVQEAGVGEVRVEGDGWRVGVRKSEVSPRVVEAAPPAEVVPTGEAPAARRIAVTAGLVGRFRAAEPPLGVGDRVESGQPLGAIESMGILTPVTAPSPGEVAGVAVVDGQGVEYGQDLFLLLESADAEVEAPFEGA